MCGRLASRALVPEAVFASAISRRASPEFESKLPLYELLEASFHARVKRLTDLGSWALSFSRATRD
jgi:hypothetical protein